MKMRTGAVQFWCPLLVRMIHNYDICHLSCLLEIHHHFYHPIAEDQSLPPGKNHRHSGRVRLLSEDLFYRSNPPHIEEEHVHHIVKG